jgi:hypothetical protein
MKKPPKKIYTETGQRLLTKEKRIIIRRIMKQYQEAYFGRTGKRVQIINHKKQGI